MAQYLKKRYPLADFCIWDAASVIPFMLHVPNIKMIIIDVERLESNLKTLSALSRRTGCHILLAQKAFSCYAVYPLVASYLQGATASGLYEARLGREHMPGKENHVFSPAFREDEIDEIIGLCDHMVFNSPRQLGLYGPRAKAAGLTVGLRVNPELSTQDHAIYDPCSEGSRLGTTAAERGRRKGSGSGRIN